MSLLDNLPHECTIQRRVRAADDFGGASDSLTVEQTGVECWEQQASASEIQEYDKRGMNVTRKIYFVADPAVTPRHQITITKRLDVAVAVASQTALDVLSNPMPDSSAGLGILYKVMVGDNTGVRP